MAERFWKSLYSLLDTHAIVIDRPAGSAHPNFPGLIYPLAYGYLNGTRSQDDNGIDVWRGSGDASLVNGIFCNIDLLKSDCEIKIVLGCSPQEIKIIAAFHNDFSQAALWIPNPTL